MSTCGMFISRETWDEIQGYPPELGVYGGGENYLNYVLSVLDRKKWVLDHGRLEHYAEVRGYSWDGRDWLRNRMIAIYMAGGEDWLARCVRAIGEARRITHRQLRIMEEEILTNPGLIARRERIASMAVTTLEDWAEQWKGHELYEQPAEWM